jgi:hypothetical protein
MTTRRLNLITTAQAERARQKLKSVWSEESRLSQKVLIRCMDLLEQIAANLKKIEAQHRAKHQERKTGRAPVQSRKPRSAHLESSTFGKTEKSADSTQQTSNESEKYTGI